MNLRQRLIFVSGSCNSMFVVCPDVGSFKVNKIRQIFRVLLAYLLACIVQL